MRSRDDALMMTLGTERGDTRLKWLVTAAGVAVMSSRVRQTATSGSTRRLLHESGRSTHGSDSSAAAQPGNSSSTNSSIIVTNESDSQDISSSSVGDNDNDDEPELQIIPSELSDYSIISDAATIAASVRLPQASSASSTRLSTPNGNAVDVDDRVAESRSRSEKNTLSTSARLLPASSMNSAVRDLLAEATSGVDDGIRVVRARHSNFGSNEKRGTSLRSGYNSSAGFVPHQFTVSPPQPKTGPVLSNLRTQPVPTPKAMISPTARRDQRVGVVIQPPTARRMPELTVLQRNGKESQRSSDDGNLSNDKRPRQLQSTADVVKQRLQFIPHQSQSDELRERVSQKRKRVIPNSTSSSPLPSKAGQSSSDTPSNNSKSVQVDSHSDQARNSEKGNPSVSGNSNDEICEIIDSGDESQHTTSIKPAQRSDSKVGSTVILTYTGGVQFGTITISAADCSRLDEGIFLNDSIIDFYLAYVYSSVIDDQHRRSSYVFNTFFFSMLNKCINRSFPTFKLMYEFKQKLLNEYGSTNSDDTKPSVSNAGGSNSFESGQKNFESAKRDLKTIQKWTEKINEGVFQKKYLIVPINEDQHWYLAIIYNPYATIDEDDVVEHVISESPSEENDGNAAVNIMDDEVASVDSGIPVLNKESKVQSTETEHQSSQSSDTSTSSLSSTTTTDTLQTASNYPDDKRRKSLANIADNTRKQNVQSASPIFNGSPQNSDDEGKVEMTHDGSRETIPSQTTSDGMIAQQLQTAEYSLRPRRKAGEGRPKSDWAFLTYESPRTKRSPPTPAERSKLAASCVIIILDSLRQSHLKTIRKLKMFLELEALARFPEKTFEAKKIQFVHVPVPVQTNLSDCGVFLLSYVEKFLKSPSNVFSQLVYDRLGANWFDVSQIPGKRQKIKELITTLASVQTKESLD